MRQKAKGISVPDLVWKSLERDLPPAIKQAAIVRNYNRVTGASLSHLELQHLSVEAYDEILLVADNTDLLSGQNETG